MAQKVQKPCKVCGKMYTPCSDCERDKTAFHWRTVACSIECGMEYFRMVEEARKPKIEEEAVISVLENAVETDDENLYSVDIVEEVYVIDKPCKKKSTKLENKEESEQID